MAAAALPMYPSGPRPDPPSQHALRTSVVDWFDDDELAEDTNDESWAYERPQTHIRGDRSGRASDATLPVGPESGDSFTPSCGGEGARQTHTDSTNIDVLQAELFAAALEGVVFSAGEEFPSHPGATIELAEALNGRGILEAALSGSSLDEVPMGPIIEALEGDDLPSSPRDSECDINVKLLSHLQELQSSVDLK